MNKVINSLHDPIANRLNIRLRKEFDEEFRGFLTSNNVKFSANSGPSNPTFKLKEGGVTGEEVECYSFVIESPTEEVLEKIRAWDNDEE